MTVSRLAISTADVLDELGYDFYRFTTQPVAPSFADKTFSELLPQLASSSEPRCAAIAGMRLYEHQEKTLNALTSGENVVLKSGTGSGKTEAWFLYSAINDVKTIAIYPTLALANDQLTRLREYTAALGRKTLALDALKRSNMLKRMSFRELRKELGESHILITNPAFLLNELKKIGAGKPSLIKQFVEKAGLLVVDDFDFYGPRSIALLFSMVKLLVQTVNPNLQLAFITAALENPNEVAQYLTMINNRRTTIIEGHAFHPANNYYIVLGKSLRRTWEELRSQMQKFREAGAGDDVIKALEDYQLFKKLYFKVIEVAKAAGVKVPDETVDVADILARYVQDDGVTLVFTRGIARAEELARRVASRLSSDRAVAAHHHLLLKTQREEIEERARRGEVKILISPRTLSQGIDIGLVVRVVHVGLPDSVREFRQREGRKGRRPEIERTETVIIPSGLWDRDLLTRGVEALRKWIELPGEKVIVNKENLYSKLFETLYRFISPSLRKTLSPEDYNFLRRLKLEEDGELTFNGKNTWLKMNFYEFAPSYGIKRMRTTETGGIERLEDISHVDLVEKFQIGCIDYSSDGIVVEHRLGGRSSRVITAVVVDDLAEKVMRHHDALAYVLEEYERTKARWGEPPSIRRDYFHGKLHSEVMCVVHAPSQGFGLYTKIPNRVQWRILSDRKRIETFGDRTHIYRERRTMEVPTPTRGIYTDYTYGISFEVEPRESVELLRLGLAFIMILMRRLLGVAFDTIKYDIMVMGERKVIGMHETESAGLLVRLDWGKFYEMTKNYTPDELDEIFLEEVDELAYSSFITLKLDWDTVKQQALNIIDYIRLRDTLRIKIRDLSLDIPRPSRALKLATISAADFTLREDLRSGLYAVALFDGEETTHVVGVKELGQPDEEVSKILARITQLMNQGFRIAVYELESLKSMLASSGLSGLQAVLLGAEGMGRLVKVRDLLANSLGDRLPLEVVEEALGMKREVELKDIIYSVEEEKRRIPKMSFIRSVPERLSRKISQFMQDEVRNIYTAALVAERLSDSGGSGG